MYTLPMTKKMVGLQGSVQAPRAEGTGTFFEPWFMSFHFRMLVKMRILATFATLATLAIFATFATPQANAQLQDPEINFVTTGAFEIRASNPNLIPISATMTLTLTDVSSSPGSPIQYVLPANATDVVIATLAVTGPNPAASYSNSWAPGDYTAVPDNYAYALPFEVGESFRVDQGEGGSFSHQPFSVQNHLAIDFGMPVGTPIHAIRDGVVFNIVEDKPSGGNNPALASEANYVQVLHSDGTYAEYVHLDQNGVTVSLGDTVARGQMIALSGDSGYVDGAHLHLALIRNNWNNNQAMPFRSVSMNFDTAQGSPIVLEEGTTYSHPAVVVEAPRLFFDGTTLSWTVPAGTSFQVEASTDLENWSAVSSVLESTGAQMTATTTRANPLELYRLRFLP